MIRGCVWTQWIGIVFQCAHQSVEARRSGGWVIISEFGRFRSRFLVLVGIRRKNTLFNGGDIILLIRFNDLPHLV